MGKGERPGTTLIAVSTALKLILSVSIFQFLVCYQPVKINFNALSLASELSTAPTDK